MRVGVLLIWAIIPSLFSTMAKPDIPWSSGYTQFCTISLLSWCCAFGVFYIDSSAKHRKRLLLLLPLVVFAFCIPVAPLFVWMSFLRAAWSGAALP
ncbi:MAG: hypothetical protein WA324_23890 [Bryobacteraceae bacterium]